VGTLALVGLDQARIPATVAALDHAVDGLRDVRAGGGALCTGAFARLIATDLWAVRAGLITLRQAVWTAGSKFAPGDAKQPQARDPDTEVPQVNVQRT
jgi:hypothetical protein